MSELLALNDLTGRVHDYAGAGLGQTLDCGCDLDEADREALRLIDQERFERSIWEPAACLSETDSAES